MGVHTGDLQAICSEIVLHPDPSELHVLQSPKDSTLGDQMCRRTVRVEPHTDEFSDLLLYLPHEARFLTGYCPGDSCAYSYFGQDAPECKIINSE